MCTPFTPLLHLAPLQQAMLKTSGHGHHVEQVVVVFSPSVMPKQIMSAWVETVASTEALRLQFLREDAGWLGVPFTGVIGGLDTEIPRPESWEEWLAADRTRSLLTPGCVPWRAVYWPEAGRFIWTFHHAMLDGRSITRILKGFVERIEGKNPGRLRLSRWQPAPAEAFKSVRAMLAHDFIEQACRFSPDQDLPEPAVCHLGEAFLERLESLTKLMEVTVPTLITWSWGQALARERRVSRVVVEQLRAGSPQPGAAGFTMNSLPVQIVKACRGDALDDLHAFREQLLELRKFENVSLEDFCIGYPLDNSVIMVEHRTLAHELSGPIIEALALHEAKGEALGATAHLLPDLRLEVEGPGRHAYLKAWIEVLEDQVGGA